jgi:hypothetical protein
VDGLPIRAFLYAFLYTGFFFFLSFFFNFLKRNAGVGLAGWSSS